MKPKCQVCGGENGSCNRYAMNDGREITICPTCLAWGMDVMSQLARDAHRAGRLIKAKPKKED